MNFNGKAILYVNVFGKKQDARVSFSVLVSGGKDKDGKNKPNGFMYVKVVGPLKNKIESYFGIEKVSDYNKIDKINVNVKSGFLSYEEFETRDGESANKFVLVITKGNVLDEDDEDDEDVEKVDEEDTIIPPKEPSKKGSK